MLSKADWIVQYLLPSPISAVSWSFKARAGLATGATCGTLWAGSIIGVTGVASWSLILMFIYSLLELSLEFHQ